MRFTPNANVESRANEDVDLSARSSSPRSFTERSYQVGGASRFHRAPTLELLAMLDRARASNVLLDVRRIAEVVD